MSCGDFSKDRDSEGGWFSGSRFGPLSWAVLLAGLVITLLVAAVIHHRDRLYNQELFDHEAKLLESELQERLDDYKNVLRACHGIIAHDPDLEPRDWHIFVKSLDIATTFQGVELLSFIRYVRQPERAAFEARQRRKYPDFAIQPPQVRDDYMVVALIEPSPELRPLLGFDVGTDPGRRALATLAGERGEAELSDPIPALSPLPAAGNVFIYYMPLYQRGEPSATPEERKRALLGWVSINFALDGFVRGIVDAHPALSVGIWNGPDPARDARLYGGGAARERKADFRFTGALSIGGRSWALAVASTPRFEAAMAGYAVPAVLVAGLLISIMLSRYLSLLIKGRSNAYALAGLKTRELEIAHEDLTRAFNDLKDTQVQLVHAEKMASLGQLVAGVAHELNNPISFIYSNSGHMEEYVGELFGLIDALCRLPQDDETRARCEELVARAELEYLRGDILKIIHSGKDGASRVKEIVLSLRRFSRLDEAERKPVPLEDGLNDTLAILRHQLKNQIVVQTDYRLNEPVSCFPGQINQVFMNILVNAIQAMTGGGSLRVATRAERPWAVVEIADSGPGMAPEVLSRIFDPFFTTKKVGEGTGLGLSISYGIVDRHGGRILVHSQLGVGTCFEIRLPYIQVSSTGAASAETPPPGSGEC